MRKMINSIYVKNYRAFNEGQTLELADLQKITFLIGPNNSGKSLIARVFSIFDFEMRDTITSNFFTINHFSDYDFHKICTDSPIEIEFKLNTKFFTSTRDVDLAKVRHLSDLSLCFKIIKNRNQCFWLYYLSSSQIDSHTLIMDSDDFKSTYNAEFTTVSSLMKEDVERLCIRIFKEIQNSILVFDPIRSFDRQGNAAFSVSGGELIKWLDEKENPSLIRKAKLQVKDWLEHEFNLEAPEDVQSSKDRKSMEFIFKDGLVFSSAEIGTGYTMLYILLMEIFRKSKRLIIIDEIESHLQPGLIRVLMRIIRDSQAQYIITTHSPTVMESSREGDFLYRFKKINGASIFEGFFRHHSSNEQSDAKIMREVCNELGIIPGDALLSNVVIWVEGPSEILWLRTLLKHYYPKFRDERGLTENLIEGLHYSIVMTGGGLIANYEFSEDEKYVSELSEGELLKVLRVNPNSFVMIDSDNVNTSSEKYRRMMRIARELNNQNKLHKVLNSKSLSDEEVESKRENIPNLWILKGKELENYAHPELLKNFYEERSSFPTSNIAGVENCNDWDVFSETEGVGAILERRGIKNIKADNGAIKSKHKIDFARYMFNNFSPDHLDVDPQEGLCPNVEMMEDLLGNLDKLLEYIANINGLKSKVLTR